MVHYGPKQYAAQMPPPICPKCGSHRTQIVGRSPEGQTMIVRCNTCGERSSVSSDVGSAQVSGSSHVGA
ncbi:MAG TPA: hypothetical protein VJP86_07415 [Vicinamibacterales bacterium]|nr:hypothetical protein [Vicinamibacterales bacterium]